MPRKEEKSHLITTKGEEISTNEGKFWYLRAGRIPNGLTFWFAFVCMGISYSILGPTFLDLLVIAGADVDTGSVILSAAFLGYLLGNLIGGLLLEKVDYRLAIGVSVILSGVLDIVMPRWPSVVAMAIVEAAMCICIGVTDIGLHTLSVQIFGKDVGPILQLLHFGFSVGGIVGPLIAAPFVSKSSSTGDVSGIAQSAEPYNTSQFSNTTDFHDPGDTRVPTAYLILGCITFVSALPFFMVYCIIGRTPSVVSATETIQSSQRTVKHKRILFALAGAFFAVYSCVEVTFSSFLATYAVEYLNWSKPDSAILTTVYWLSLSVVRFGGIFLAAFVTTWKLLAVQLLIMDVVLFGFLFGGKSSSVTWGCCVLFGLGSSCVIASAFTWVNECILPLSSRVTSVLNTCLSIGAFVTPVLLGYLFDTYTPLWFIYILLGGSLLCSLIFLTIKALLYKLGL